MVRSHKAQRHILLFILTREEVYLVSVFIGGINGLTFPGGIPVNTEVTSLSQAGSLYVRSISQICPPRKIRGTAREIQKQGPVGFVFNYSVQTNINYAIW